MAYGIHLPLCPWDQWPKSGAISVRQRTDLSRHRE